MESQCQDSDSHSIAYQLCDLRQITQSPASASKIVVKINSHIVD